MMCRRVGWEVRGGGMAGMHRAVAVRQMPVAAGIMATPTPTRTRTFVRSGMRKARRGHRDQAGTAKREREGIGIHVVLPEYTRREERRAASVAPPPSVATLCGRHFAGAVPPTIDAMRASSEPVVEQTTGAVPKAIGVAVAWIRVATSVAFSDVGLRRDTTLMLIE